MMETNLGQDVEPNTVAQALINFKRDISIIRLKAQQLGLSDEYINNIFTQTFSKLKTEATKACKSTKERIKAQRLCQIISYTFVLFCFCTIFLYTLVKFHYATSSVIMRNAQNFAYPTSKFIRFLSVPLLQIFPTLTNLYDESCLVENPYFYVSDMDCFPCEKIASVSNLTNGVFFNFLFGTPFIARLNDVEITLKDFRNFIAQNKAVFEKEKSRIKLEGSLNKIEDIFDVNEEMDISPSTHFFWRIKSHPLAATLRKLYPKPQFLVDRMGETLERFIFIDGIEAPPYPFPDVECSYALAVQSSGERTILLNPSDECRTRCRPISVLLQESHVLWYNWWYWRPVSMPTITSTVPSITYINSYC